MKTLAIILSTLFLPTAVFASSSADYAMQTKYCAVLNESTGMYHNGAFVPTESKWACYKNKKTLTCNVIMGEHIYSNKFKVIKNNSVILAARDSNNSVLIIDKESELFLITGTNILTSELGVLIQQATCKGEVLKHGKGK